MIKGVICDLDGFLVETWKTEPLPGVLDTLAELARAAIKAVKEGKLPKLQPPQE